MTQEVELQGAEKMFGLTAKQNGFAQAVAKGATQSDAYRMNYDVSNMKPPAIWSAASELMDNPKVAARVKHLLEQQEERMLRDAVRIRRHVMENLLRESNDFEKENGASASTRLRALELLGKVDFVRLFSQKGNEEERQDRKPEEIEAELRDKLRSLFKA